MSTGKQLSVLLAVLIGGMSLVAVVATVSVHSIRDDILRLSQETSPTQVQLARLQHGFERIRGAFARISAASSAAELSASESELADRMAEVRSIATARSTAAGAAVASVQGGVIDDMQRSGDELLGIARQRIEARKQIAEANRNVSAEMETVAQVAHTLSDAMTVLEKSSLEALAEARKTSIDSNTSIKALLIERESIEQLRSCVSAAGVIDSKFRLNVLRDKVGGILDHMASQDLPDADPGNSDLTAEVKAFVAGFGAMFEGEKGLLAARGALIAAPRDTAARAIYDARQKAVTRAIDELSNHIAEEIDPLELAVMKANVGINQATERIAQVILVSSWSADVNARARSIQALAWQLLAASDSAALDRIVTQIVAQNDAVSGDLARIHRILTQHAWEAGDGAENASRQAFTHVRQLLVGPSGVASVARQGLEKQKQAERLFSAALQAIRQVAVAASSRARAAEGAQEVAVNRIRRLSAWTFLLVGMLALTVLVIGSAVGTRIREAILASEAGQFRLQQKLREQAFHDALTGLPNRLHFADLLEQAIANATAEGAGLAVLCVDLDRFKQVNDTLGHRIGDLFLIEVSRRMEQAVSPDGIVARMGGDEFTVLLTKVRGKEGVKAVAASLLSALSGRFVIENCSLEASGSIGVAVFPEDGADAETLQRNSDQAMYRAKKSGRNQIAAFDFHVNQSIQEFNNIEERLRDAVRTGEFSIQYQPQFSADGQVVCLEALMRFRHPEFGQIPPSRFIPIAEECGLILPMGRWVLREVVRQSVHWQREGLAPVRIGVNVSALQFAQSDFYESICQILMEFGLAPELLELELTESAVMSKPDEAYRQMSKFREIGVRISIDDFGTGYSSLSYLHKLPVNALKIDQSFVRDIHSPTSTLPLIQAIVSAGHALGLTVVAEGVETNSQRQALTAIGCDTMQGFLFARPLSVDMVEILLRGTMGGGRTAHFEPAQQAEAMRLVS
jgi:diguanylate cyclase (GGDEF)-like protein